MLVTSEHQIHISWHLKLHLGIELADMDRRPEKEPMTYNGPLLSHSYDQREC